MAKKQKSFADKASGNKDKDMVFIKYVKSVQSDITGRWRFNDQMVKMKKGEQLDVALKRMDEAANLVDIDLSEFVGSVEDKADALPKEEPKHSGDDVTEGSDGGQVNDLENIRSNNSGSSEEE